MPCIQYSSPRLMEAPGSVTSSGSSGPLTVRYTYRALRQKHLDLALLHVCCAPRLVCFLHFGVGGEVLENPTQESGFFSFSWDPHNLPLVFIFLGDSRWLSPSYPCGSEACFSTTVAVETASWHLPLLISPWPRYCEILAAPPLSQGLFSFTIAMETASWCLPLSCRTPPWFRLWALESRCVGQI